MTTVAAGAHTRSVWHRWPIALGLAIAVLQLLGDPDTDTVASTTGVAVLCYLGAAAFDRRWVAWAACFVLPPVVVISVAADLAWWVIFAVVAVVVLSVGLLRKVPRDVLSAQAGALVVYGGAAVAALFLAPRLGLALAGMGLAAHAIWDVVHYRRNKVVHRSLAEFCVFLDVPLGVGAIVLAIIG
jgi:hypothetical protein